MKIFLCVGFLFFLLSSCVSSILRAPPPKFNSRLTIPELSSNFERARDADLPSWKEKSTGVRIGLISDCENPSARLSDAHHVVSDNLDKRELVSEMIDTSQERRIFLKLFKGEIEAAPIEVEVAAVRIEDCIVISSLSGHPGRIASLRNEWLKFVNKIEYRR